MRIPLPEVQTASFAYTAPRVVGRFEAYHKESRNGGAECVLMKLNSPLRPDLPPDSRTWSDDAETPGPLSRPDRCAAWIPATRPTRADLPDRACTPLRGR